MELYFYGAFFLSHAPLILFATFMFHRNSNKFVTTSEWIFHFWVNNYIIQCILKSAFLQTQVLMAQQSDNDNKASDKRRARALIYIISEALHSLARATHAILLELWTHTISLRADQAPPAWSSSARELLSCEGGCAALFGEMCSLPLH